METDGGDLGQLSGPIRNDGTWESPAGGRGGYSTDNQNPWTGHTNDRGNHWGGDHHGGWGNWDGKSGKGGDNNTGRVVNNPGESNTSRPPGGMENLSAPISNVLDQTGKLVSSLGSMLFGNDRSQTNMTQNGANGAPLSDYGSPGRAGQGAQPGSPTRLQGENTPQGLPSRNESANPQQQQAAGARGGEAQGMAKTGQPNAQQQATTQQPQNAQQNAQQQVLRSGVQAAAAQALLGGFTAGQAGLAQTAQLAQNPALANAAGQPQALPQQLAMAQGNPMAQQANGTQPQQPTLAQEKPQTLAQAQQQLAAQGEKELRNPQQLPAEARQRQEPGATDRALTKQTAEQPPPRTLADARNAETQARDKSLRDGATETKRAGQTENPRQIGKNARRGELAGSERRATGTLASLRQALDWVGQQARGTDAEARTDEEGVTTMRVVAGLLIAAVVVGVAIAVLYALRVAFVP